MNHAHPNLGPVAASRRKFNPLVDVPNLLWFVHSDDSTVVSTKVSAINDRLAAYAFSQSNSTNRPIANTTEKPGHTVWEFSGTGRRYLSRSGAPLAGMLNSAPACTMSAFAKVVDLGSANDVCAHTNDVTSYSSSVRHSHNTDRHRWIENNAGVQTQYQSALGSFTATSGYQLWSGVSDGAGGLKWLLDDIEVATTTGTHQTPTGLAHVVLGEALNNSDASKQVYIGGFFACLGQVSSLVLGRTSEWFAESFQPIV